MENEKSLSYGTALILLSACILLPMVSESMLVAALPGIEVEFSTTGIVGAWILPIVLLFGAGLSPFFGTLGDNLGRKRVLSICLLFYVVGVILSGFAWSIWSLLIFRAMQGIGIAASPIAYAIISEHFPPGRITFGIGVLSACYGAGTLLGIFFGSVVTEMLGWRWTYFIMIPVVIAHLTLVVLKIPSSCGNTRRKPDWTGALSLLGSMFFLMSALTLGYRDGFWSPIFASSVLLSIIMLIIFIYCEKKAKFPSIDLGMLKTRKIAIIAFMALLVNMSTFLYIQVFPFIIQSPAGLMLDALFVGYVMVPGSIADMIASPAAGFWIRKRGFKIPLHLGGALMVAAPALFFLLPLSITALALVYTVFCAGMGMVATSYLIAMIDTVPQDRTAGATGLLNSFTNIGGMIGPMITGIFLAAFTVKMTSDGTIWNAPTIEAFTFTFATGAVTAIVILALVIATATRKSGRI